MSADQLSNPDLFKRLAARGLEVSDQTKDSAFSDMDGEGILVSTVGSGGTTQVVNSDGSAFVSPFPREAGLHAYAATATAGAGTVIATVTPTVVGVYEVVINAKVSAGSSGEAVLDNMQLRNNGTAVMRILNNPVAINSHGEERTYTVHVNWTTGAIDVTQVAASTATNNTYRVSITAKRVG